MSKSQWAPWWGRDGTDTTSRSWSGQSRWRSSTWIGSSRSWRFGRRSKIWPRVDHNGSLRIAHNPDVPSTRIALYECCSSTPLPSCHHLRKRIMINEGGTRPYEQDLNVPHIYPPPIVVCSHKDWLFHCTKQSVAMVSWGEKMFPSLCRCVKWISLSLRGLLILSLEDNH